jgi:hypothetical protein
VIAIPPRPEAWGRTTLARHREPGAREECWHIYFGDVSILPQGTPANGNFTMYLVPNESAVITCTGTLVAKKMVH